jgi:DNA (cytosine-5)-methyltransferase 1
MKIPLISFFTGGGFLDLGFEQAGFDIRWTNEHNAVFASIYSHGTTAWRRSTNPRAPKAKISSTESIATLHPDDVVSQAFPRTRPALFGVIGGPPCTDFSNGGLHGGHDGDAGRMTTVYVKMLRHMRPSFFLLENVPNLASHPRHKAKFDGLLASLDAAGFSVVIKTLNALEYGIPQERRRLFAIGFRRELLRSWFPDAVSPKRMMELHLKWPEKSHPDAKTKYTWATTSAFGAEPTRPADVPLDLCAWHAVCRKPDPETLANGQDFFVPYSTKFGEIKEGDVSGKSFKRLHRYRYSPTAWYGNNEVHMHPFKPRRLSVRESLRLQAVPDTYKMPADASLSAKFKVVGNGVPCRLAHLIAATLKNFIETNETQLQDACAAAR